MNTQERSFYNSVTGFSARAIERGFKKEDTATEKFWTIKATVGKELAKARDYYNSEDGKAEMDDAGITYNDINDFFETITAGKMKKPSAYKRIKVYENIETNADAPKEFVKLVNETLAENPSAKIVKSDEGFNYFCANGELKIKGETPTANESESSEESESESSEESESEENQSDDSGTKFSFTKSRGENTMGGCIRMDKDYEILAEDGDTPEIRQAMIEYLTNKGYEIVLPS